MRQQLRSAARVAVMVVAFAAVAACGSAPPVPSDNFYRLQAVSAQSAFASPIFRGVLEVERFNADGIVAGRPLVYSEAGQPNQLREYHYHFWTQAPTVMLRDEMVGVLRKVRAADQVVTPEVRAAPDHVLTGRIIRLERIVGSEARTVLELELAVREQSSNKVELLKTYRAETTPTGSSVGDAVAALNEGLSLVVAEFLDDLGKR